MYEPSWHAMVHRQDCNKESCPVMSLARLDTGRRSDTASWADHADHGQNHVWWTAVSRTQAQQPTLYRDMAAHDWPLQDLFIQYVPASRYQPQATWQGLMRRTLGLLRVTHEPYILTVKPDAHIQDSTLTQVMTDYIISIVYLPSALRSM